MLGGDATIDPLIEALRGTILLVGMLRVFGWLGQGGTAEGKRVVAIESAVTAVRGMDMSDEATRAQAFEAPFAAFHTQADEARTYKPAKAFIKAIGDEHA